MPSIYLIVTTLLLISLALLGFAETFSDVVDTPTTMSGTVGGFDADRDVPE
jgi:hypothetical protein